jgi:hypothetical protein
LCVSFDILRFRVWVRREGKKKRNMKRRWNGVVTGEGGFIKDVPVHGQRETRMPAHTPELFFRRRK